MVMTPADMRRRKMNMLMSMSALASASSRVVPQALFINGEQGVWYDPSDFSTMFQDTAGTSPVTATGQSVALIRDKSGRGNHASQSVGASMPTLQIDASGRYFLLFDGVDDSIETASVNFSGSDKVTVFAGIRKLSDAATGMLAELSPTSAANNGSWSIVAPSTAGANSYQFQCRGSIQVIAGSGIFAAAPNTAVLTCIGDISGDTTSLRRNGAVVQTATGDQGTGNFGTWQLYIGRRGGSTLPYNGRLYSLIVRNAKCESAQIFDTETWVNGKTGAY